MTSTLSRRNFLALSAAAPLACLAAPASKIPVGLELYSVRNELKQDLTGTVRAVAKMGYQGVEFYAPYFDWTPDYAKQTRKLLDDLGIRCFSTHNGSKSFTPEGLPHAIELNQILGSSFVVWASAGRIQDLDGWKGVAEKLNQAGEKMKPAKLRTGYHNHSLEWIPIEGKRPMEILAAETGPDVMLQLDVGPCVEMGSDPVAWIKEHPGRTKGMHVKDWAPGPDKGFKVLLGEGAVPWKDVLSAARTTGGLEYALIEQEGSAYPPLETAQRCLAAWRSLTAT